jgi:hypothetical protein
MARQEQHERIGSANGRSKRVVSPKRWFFGIFLHRYEGGRRSFTKKRFLLSPLSALNNSAATSSN